MMATPMPQSAIHNAVARKATSLTTFSATPARAAVASISGRMP
jgi:hypothetical protein